jgi:hypothetical protein
VFRQPLAVDRTTGALSLRRRRPVVEPPRPARTMAPIHDLAVDMPLERSYERRS